MLRVLYTVICPVLYKNDLIGGRLMMAGKSMRILGCKEPLSKAFFFFFLRCNVIVFFSVGVFIFFFSLIQQIKLFYTYLSVQISLYISHEIEITSSSMVSMYARKSVGRKCAHFDNKGHEQYDIQRRKMSAICMRWTL